MKVKTRKTRTCRHDFEMCDKWLGSNGKSYWEFYCKRCLMIRTVEELRSYRHV